MIKLIKKYPYDNNYDYVKLFDTKAKQTAYFNSFDSINIDIDNDESYIKEENSFIVEYNVDYLISENVNYLIYNNGYKDMFCFIISKEYVDEINTRLYIDIDVLNTFNFDFSIKKSFVERKVCSLTEITDFDEGLNIGEHVIIDEITAFQKQYTYFAMFGGIKNQQIIFNGDQISNVIETPFTTLKPKSYIDDIQYPLFFMPLKESYKSPSYSDILPPNGGGSVNPNLPTISNSLGLWYAPTYGIISATFPYYPSGGSHTGLDIANNEGTPIYASRGGKCTTKDLGSTSYGKVVYIDHTDGSRSIYAHNFSIMVVDGQEVQTGQQIATMGSTGNSTGNHCHFEIRDKNGMTINPAPTLKVGEEIKLKAVI